MKHFFPKHGQLRQVMYSGSERTEQKMNTRCSKKDAIVCLALLTISDDPGKIII